MGKIRSGIDDMLRGLLSANDAYRHRYHHVHIDIMMNMVFDRETPRSRKVNNEKARAERKKNIDSRSDACEFQGSSDATEATTSTEHESPPSATRKSSNPKRPFATKVVGAAPPIPRLITNDSVPHPMPMPHPIVNRIVDYQDTRWTGETTQWSNDQFLAPSRPGFIVGVSGQVTSDMELERIYWHRAKEIPPQQHSYWHQAHSTQFASVVPQPFCHLPDIQIHQYYPNHHMIPLNFENTHHPHTTLGMHQCHMMIPGNQHYVGLHATPETRFCVDKSTLSGDTNENSNMEFFQDSFGNISTRDDTDFSTSSVGFGSPSPGITSPMPSLMPLETAEVCSVVATETENIVTNSDSRTSSPPTTLPVLNTTVGGCPIEETTPHTNNSELCSIPVHSKQLASTATES